ncbi:MAG: hypothetical protein IJH79_05725 [Lentisphaeria bacterium]|nr:hypothetical protein [Lentisphaeria bacterium]
MIAAGSGYNGCATATDFHRDSLLPSNQYGGQYTEVFRDCKSKIKKKTRFFSAGGNHAEKRFLSQIIFWSK